MLPSPKPNLPPHRAVRIALLADPHTTRGTVEDQPLYGPRFDRAVEDTVRAGVDLALIVGDLTQGGLPEEIEDLQERIALLRVPVLYVPGNHDVGNKAHPGVHGVVTHERVLEYERRLGPSSFCTFIEGLRIIGINGSLLGSGLAREQDQWLFLEHELGRTTTSPTLVVCHYPLYERTLDEPGTDYWNVEPAPRLRLMELLRGAGVAAFLSGHLHRPLTHRLGGTLLFSAPPIAFGLPAGRQPEGWTLLTVAPDGAIETEFRPVCVDADTGLQSKADPSLRSG